MLLLACCSRGSGMSRWRTGSRLCYGLQGLRKPGGPPGCTGTGAGPGSRRRGTEDVAARREAERSTGETASGEARKSWQERLAAAQQEQPAATNDFAGRWPGSARPTKTRRGGSTAQGSTLRTHYRACPAGHRPAPGLLLRLAGHTNAWVVNATAPPGTSTRIAVPTAGHFRSASQPGN